MSVGELSGFVKSGSKNFTPVLYESRESSNRVRTNETKLFRKILLQWKNSKNSSTVVVFGF